MVKTGSQGPYTWFQSNTHYLSALINKVPGLIVNKYIAVTAHDGEPYSLTTEEIRAGWQKHSRVALSPLVQRTSILPQNQYDEWYTLDTIAPFDIQELFVNYGGFSLVRGTSDNPFLPDSLKQKEGNDTTLGQRQERFWKQINEIRPESYVAESDKLIVVTRNPELKEQLYDFFMAADLRMRHHANLRDRLSGGMSRQQKKMSDSTIR